MEPFHNFGIFICYFHRLETHKETPQPEGRINDENSSQTDQRKDNEEESGFEDEVDDYVDGSSGEEGKNIEFALCNPSISLHENKFLFY